VLIPNGLLRKKDPALRAVKKPPARGETKPGSGKPILGTLGSGARNASMFYFTL